MDLSNRYIIIRVRKHSKKSPDIIIYTYMEIVLFRQKKKKQINVSKTCTKMTADTRQRYYYVPWSNLHAISHVNYARFSLREREREREKSVDRNNNNLFGRTAVVFTRRM